MASEDTSRAGFVPLTPVEARVAAVLVEKQATVPDSYPLSLNALVSGCNQKSSRDPVMELDEPAVLAALEALRERSLVVEVSGSRVSRFEHNLPRGLGLPSAAVALLTVLILRGPLTAAELRLHSERLHRFADLSSVEAFLDELTTRQPVRVVKLPRAPGAREARWAHLLCGEVAMPVPMPTLSMSPTAGADSLHQDRLDRLEAEVARLRALVERLAAELGVTIDPVETDPS
jgi:uncharacterized protein YceH (UPF0502 family)